MDAMDFKKLFSELGYANDRQTKTERADYLWSKIKYYNEMDIKTAIDDLIASPVDRVTLAVLIDKIGVKKRNREQGEGINISGHWNGTECTHCNMGLIFTTRQRHGITYSYVWRCPACRSYDAPGLPFYDESKTTQAFIEKSQPRDYEPEPWDEPQPAEEIL